MTHSSIRLALWTAVAGLLGAFVCTLFLKQLYASFFCAWLVALPLIGLQFVKSPSVPKIERVKVAANQVIEENQAAYPGQSHNQRAAKHILASGAGLLIIAFGLYFWHGYSLPFLILWLGGAALVASFYWTARCRNQDFPSCLSQPDWMILAAVGIVFSFVYIAFPDAFPYQMNTDEVIIRDQIRRMCFREPNLNPLGPSGYFAFPVLIHLVFGWLAQMMGGITFLHLRTVHACFGVLCAVFSFVFFRTLKMHRGLALVATIIVGFNHSLLAISRMVSRNNTSMLLEVIALSVMFRGAQKNCPFLMYMGGIAAGTTFYTYPPSRVTVFVFLLSYFLSRWSAPRRKDSVRAVIPLLAGLLITITPMIWASHTAPPGTFDYADNQFLLTPGGRIVEKEQVQAATEAEGVATNIKYGLLAFNWPIHDYSNIYINQGFAFVDPVTGMMIWIGLLFIYRSRRVRTEQRDADILCAASFISLWLVLSFLITFAPSYTRLFVTLPFVAYLAAHGIFWIADIANSLLPSELKASVAKLPGLERKGIRTIVAGSFVFIVIALNVNSLMAFAAYAKAHGDVEGATFRLVERLSSEPDRKFFISADAKHEYYWCRGKGEWMEWADGDDVGDRISVLSPAEILSTRLPPPFVLFLNHDLWAEVKDDFVVKYPNFTLQSMLPTGRLLAVIVSNQAVPRGSPATSVRR